MSENGLVKEVLIETETIGKKTILDIAKAKGIEIPLGYVNEIIERFYPSEEELLETLERHNAKSSKEIFELGFEKIVKLYKSRITGELGLFLQPNEEVESRLVSVGSSDYTRYDKEDECFYSMTPSWDSSYERYHLYDLFFCKRFNSLVKTGLLGKRLKKISDSEDIAEFKFDFSESNLNLKAHFYNPNFLNQCGDIILELNKDIEKQGKKVIYESQFHYDI